MCSLRHAQQQKGERQSAPYAEGQDACLPLIALFLGPWHRQAMQPSVWIFGTSASIIRGYATLLPEHLPGYRVRNWSIGNQTSIMGLMRLHQCYPSIEPDDFIVWEYPLLDMLLEPFHDRQNITDAFSSACALVAAKGAHMIVVALAPRAYITGDTDYSVREGELRAATAEINGTYLDVRDDFAAAGWRTPGEQAAQYQDDRHLLATSTANVSLADRLAQICPPIPAG